MTMTTTATMTTVHNESFFLLGPSADLVDYETKDYNDHVDDNSSCSDYECNCHHEHHHHDHDVHDEYDDDDKEEEDEEEEDDDDDEGHTDAVQAMIGTRVDGLLITKVLGLGTYGAVYIAEDESAASPPKSAGGTGHKAKYAVKCLFKVGLQPEHLVSQRQEVLVNRKLGMHKNIVQFLRHFDSNQYLLLVFEYCDRGDLFDLIKKEEAGIYNKTFAAELFVQLVDAVAHCHSKGVYHRDLKPENILISADWTVKLGDFGLATLTSQPTDFNCGSPPYMAPEVFNSQGGMRSYAAAPADVWSLGVIFFNMLYGVNPWEKAVLTDRNFRTYKDNPRKSLSERFAMTEELLEVFLGMLAIAPKQRWPLARVRETVLQLSNNLCSTVPATNNKYSSSPAVHLQAGQYMRVPRNAGGNHHHSHALTKAPLPMEAYQMFQKQPVHPNAHPQPVVGFMIAASQLASYPGPLSPAMAFATNTTSNTNTNTLSSSLLSTSIKATSSHDHTPSSSLTVQQQQQQQQQPSQPISIVAGSPSTTGTIHRRMSSQLSTSWADSADEEMDYSAAPVFSDEIPTTSTSNAATALSDRKMSLHGGSPLRPVTTIRADSAYEASDDQQERAAQALAAPDNFSESEDEDAEDNDAKKEDESEEDEDVPHGAVDNATATAATATVMPVDVDEKEEEKEGDVLTIDEDIGSPPLAPLTSTTSERNTASISLASTHGHGTAKSMEQLNRGVPPSVSLFSSWSNMLLSSSSSSS